MYDKCVKCVLYIAIPVFKPFDLLIYNILF